MGPPNTHRAFAKIPRDVSSEELREYFSKFGEVVDVYMPLDKTTGAIKGIAFVTYKSAEELETCLKNEHTMKGSSMDVVRATARPGLPGASRNDNQRSDYHPAEPYGRADPYIKADFYPRSDPYVRDFDPYVREDPYLRSVSMDARGKNTMDYRGSRNEAPEPDAYYQGFLAAQRLLTGGIPLQPEPFYGIGRPDPYIRGSHDVYEKKGRGSSGKKDITEGPRYRAFLVKVPEHLPADTIKERFCAFGEVVDVYVPVVASTGMRKGIAFVTFKTESQLERCLEQPTQDFDGVKVIVSRAEERDHVRATPREETTSSSYIADNSRPRASSRDDNAGSSASRRVFVEGVDVTLTAQELQDEFSKFGEIKDVYIPKDSRTGVPRGFCYITFASSDSVTKAVQNAPKDIAGRHIGDVKVAEARPHASAAGGGGHAQTYTSAGRAAPYSADRYGYNDSGRGDHHRDVGYNAGLGRGYESRGDVGRGHIYAGVYSSDVRGRGDAYGGVAEAGYGAYRSSTSKDRYRPY